MQGYSCKTGALQALAVNPPLQTLRASSSFGCPPPCSSQDHTQLASLKLSSIFHPWEEHQKQTCSSQHPGLIFNLLTGGQARCEHRPVNSSCLKHMQRLTDTKMWQKKHRDICSSARVLTASPPSKWSRGKLPDPTCYMKCCYWSTCQC